LENRDEVNRNNLQLNKFNGILSSTGATLENTIIAKSRTVVIILNDEITTSHGKYNQLPQHHTPAILHTFQIVSYQDASEY
jgi:hypothetical protein